MTTPEKPAVNQMARIVNSHFLQSPYEGKDWDAVRNNIIEELSVESTRLQREMLKRLLEKKEDFIEPWEDGVRCEAVPVSVIDAERARLGEAS